MHQFPVTEEHRVPQQRKCRLPGTLVSNRVLHHHLHRELGELRLGGRGRLVRAGLYLQYRDDGVKRRYFDGDFLLREQDYLSRGRGEKGKMPLNQFVFVSFWIATN